MTLTIYSNDYEIDLDPGMNGKVFVENTNEGKEFKNIDDALKYICINKINIDDIIYNYSNDNIQYFRVLNITGKCPVV